MALKGEGSWFYFWDVSMGSYADSLLSESRKSDKNCKRNKPFNISGNCHKGMEAYEENIYS